MPAAISTGKTQRALCPTVDEEVGPWFLTECPASFPNIVWWSNDFFETFWLKRWNLPAGDEVPFLVQATSKEVHSAPFGYAWYKPSPLTTTYQGDTWVWDSPTHHPAVEVYCERRVNGFFAIGYEYHAWFAGGWIGEAFPQGTAPETDGTYTGGGGEGDDCYQLIYWWYDEDWYYHEIVLDEWCEGEWET